MTSNATDQSEAGPASSSTGIWALILANLVGSYLLFQEGLESLYATWLGTPEYSHGILVPLIAGYLIWQRKHEFHSMVFIGSWGGFLLAVSGLLLFLIGELSALYILQQYAILVFLLGVVLSCTGWRVFRFIAVPLSLLFFSIPLPAFLYNNLSASLQLLSSEIGVAVIRLFGISVFLEGNVIDLGTFKLQVVEACNGLRYLFPLVTLGFLVAYIYNAALWKRALVFLSTIPITVLMNSFRIGVIGVTVDRWGQKMAEGFLHDFEGWVIFMACFGVLFVEMWLLMRLTGDRRDLREVFGLEAPVKVEGPSMCLTGPIPKPLVGSTIGLVLAVSAGYLLPERQELTPQRTAFSEFPVQFADWQGRPEPMEQVYIDALKFTDYALINFKNSHGDVINLYSAYYESQRKGESVHSPRSCLPGGGWEIQSLTQVDVPNATVDGVPLRVNRALISYGDQKQLVYYWFQQRGRVMTNEFLVKWYMLIDAIFMHRTDGALVRVIAPLTPGGDVSRLDGALNEFTADIAPMLSRYIPK